MSSSDSDDSSRGPDVFYITSDSDDSTWSYKTNKSRDRKRSSNSERIRAGSGVKHVYAFNSESEYLAGSGEFVETWIIPDAKLNLSDKSPWRREFECAHPSIPNVSLSLALFCKNERGEAMHPLFEHSIAFKSGNEPPRRCWTNVTAQLLREASVGGTLQKAGARADRNDFHAPILSRKRKFSEISVKILSKSKPSNESPSNSNEAVLSDECLSEMFDSETESDPEKSDEEDSTKSSFEEHPFKDDTTQIEPERMKEQMSNTSDTLTTLERHRMASTLAMVDKQKFSAVGLFASPGIGLASKHLQEMFARNCVTWSKPSASSKVQQDMPSAEHKTERPAQFFDLKSSKLCEVIDTMYLGPSELSGEIAVQFAAWPLSSLRSALSRDGSLRIRLTLTVYDVEKAVRSRDLIRGLHRSGMFSDFNVKVENQEFAVHKCILSAASNEFKTLLSKNDGERMLDLANVASPSGVKAFLALLYHDCFDWNAQNDVVAVIVEVLMLETRFKAENVKDQILAVILNVIDLDNVLRLFEAAIVFDESRVKEACLSFLSSKRSSIQESLCWTQLLENTPAAEKVRRELLKTFFRRQLCARSAVAAQSVKAKRLGHFPNDEAPLSGVWVIQNAHATLKTTSGQANFHSLQLQTAGPSPQKFEFKLKIFPKGRTKQLKNLGFTSLHLSLVQPRNEYKHCWAYVDLSVESSEVDGCPSFAAQNELVEFTRTKTFAIDKAWSIEDFLGSIGEDQTLRVRLGLRLVDVPGIIRCHNVVESLCKQDAVLAKLKKKEFSARKPYGDPPKAIEAVEVLTVEDAKQAIQDPYARFTHKFAFTHASLPGVSWSVAVHRYGDSQDYSVTHSASFQTATGDARHCWSGLTAQLERVRQGQVSALNPLKFRPRVFSVDKGSAMAKSSWPLTALQSAISDDGTLRIRLRLTLFNVEQAIWSRDFIRGLLQCARSSDFTIKVGRSSERCHVCVLTAASSHLKAKLTNLVRDKTLDLTSLKIKPAAVRAFLSLIYHDVFPWSSYRNIVSTIGDAMKIADELKTPQVKEQLYAVVVEAIDLENALSFLNYAISSDDLRMKEICFGFLLENCGAVQDSTCLTRLLENSASVDKMRCEFLRMFFDDKLVADYRYCTCALPGCANEFSFRGLAVALPNEVRELSEFWTIENAVVKLDEAELSHSYTETADLDGFVVVTSGWRVKLFPKGRSAHAQLQGCASVSVDRPSAPDACPAYVSISLEKQDKTRAFATDADGQSKMLVDFTRSRGLLIDKAWPAAVLRNAVNGENKLCVKIELEMVNVRESLKCYELMRSVYKQCLFDDFEMMCFKEWGGDSIMVHKCILAQRSEAFAAMLSCEMRESAQKLLDLSQTTTVDALDAFIGAIYFAPAAKPACGEATTFELLKLAHQFGLADVKIACDQLFARSIDMENVLEIFSVCRLYGLARSNSACIRYLRNNRIEFLQSSVWKDLKTDDNRSELYRTLVEELLLEDQMSVLKEKCFV